MTRSSRQRLLSRVLTVLLVTAGAGCLYLLLDAGVSRLAGRAVAAGTATAVVALGFVPGLLLADRAASRLLHGRRPSPYGVLARLTTLPIASGDLPDLAAAAEAVGTGLGARLCAITVRRPGLRDRTWRWVRPGTEPPSDLAEVPISHGDEDVGSITLDRGSLTGLDEERQQLLDALTGHLGVVLQATRAGIGLERQLRAALAHATDIAAARRRAVADADSERRRIERDLHDGVQHHLVTLSLALGLAEHQATTGRTAESLARLDQVVEGLDAAEAELARTATGVSAPELSRSGLVAALRAALAGNDRVTLDADGLSREPRFAPEVEAAVYFCCLESVNNARKHADGAPVRARLERRGDRLAFTVEDDGPGWHAEAPTASVGRGMRNMASRMASVGGHVGVRSAPGEGTTVEGWVPLSDGPPEAARSGPAVAPALSEQVRVAVRKARDVYHGTAHAEPLSALARWLDEPPRIAVAGPSPSAVQEAVQRLGAAPAARAHRSGTWSGRPDATVLPPVFVPVGSSADLGAPDGLVPSGADAVVLLVPSTGPDERGYADLLALGGCLPPSQTLAVRVPGEGVVLPPAALLRLCPVDPTASAGSALADLVGDRLVSRTDAFRARTVVERLTALLREDPPPGDGRPLQYELDRLRAGAPDLAELELLDALATADPPLPDADRAAAERLLGSHGTDLPDRLGCPSLSDPAHLVRAATEQLTHWQQVTAHPASSTGTRSVARELVRTCERLVSVARAR